MIKSELIARIAQQNPHLARQECEALVNTIINRIAGALADGDRVELRDFGTFCIRESESRASRNPRTGKQVMVPARAHVHFKPGKEMRARLNRQKIEPDFEEEAHRFLRVS